MKVSTKAYSRECVSRQSKRNEEMYAVMTMHTVAERVLIRFSESESVEAIAQSVLDFTDGLWHITGEDSEMFYNGLCKEVQDMINRTKHVEMGYAKAFEYVMKCFLIYRYKLSNIYAIGVITALWSNKNTKPVMHWLKKDVLATYGF